MKRKLTIAVDTDIEAGEFGVSVKVDPPPDAALFKELTDGLAQMIQAAAAELKAKAGA